MAKPEKNKKDKKHFFKDFKAELKKVVWPTTKQVVNNTTAVLSIVLITALIVFVLDFAFEALNTYGINKLRNLVNTSNEVENTLEDSTENTVENSTVENAVVENTVENGTENNIEEQVENTEEDVIE